MKPYYRKIATKKGVYFVAWRPEDVAGLIIAERLTPADLLSGQRSEIHYFIRDLYLLACRSALAGEERHHKTALLSRYARQLHSSLNMRH